MTHKILKLLFVLFILFSFCINFVYATDIDINLPNNDVTQNPENQEVPNDEDIQNNQDTQNPEYLNSIEDPVPETLPDSNPGTETLTPSGISTAAESSLGMGNIINILLITVGVVLILLAIAIIIRLKN